MAKASAVTVQVETNNTNQLSTWLTPQSFEAAEQIAALMASCGTMPVHIKNKGDAFRIVVQAAKWQMDPFAVAEATSVVHGRLCFEGKLVAAVLRSMNAIKGRLDYEIKGEGQDSSITVSGIPNGGDGKIKSISGTVKGWRTHIKSKDNGKDVPNQWDKDPHSALIYRGTRQWARLFTPEAMVGVYTPDEFDDVIDVTANSRVHSEPEPARTGATEVIKPDEQKPEQQTMIEDKEHPAINAARQLYVDYNEIQNGYGKKVLDTLCQLYGVQSIPQIKQQDLDSLHANIMLLNESPSTALEKAISWLPKEQTNTKKGK